MMIATLPIDKCSHLSLFVGWWLLCNLNLFVCPPPRKELCTHLDGHTYLRCTFNVGKSYLGWLLIVHTLVVLVLFRLVVS